MKALSTIQLATLAAPAMRQSFVVIQAQNNGSALRVSDAFPSLDSASYDLIHDQEPVILSFDSDDDAVSVYEEIERDLKRESTLIAGELSLVNSLGAVARSLDIDRLKD